MYEISSVADIQITLPEKNNMTTKQYSYRQPKRRRRQKDKVIPRQVIFDIIRWTALILKIIFCYWMIYFITSTPNASSICSPDRISVFAVCFVIVFYAFREYQVIISDDEEKSIEKEENHKEKDMQLEQIEDFKELKKDISIEDELQTMSCSTTSSIVSGRNIDDAHGNSNVQCDNIVFPLDTQPLPTIKKLPSIDCVISTYQEDLILTQILKQDSVTSLHSYSNSNNEEDQPEYEINEEGYSFCLSSKGEVSASSIIGYIPADSEEDEQADCEEYSRIEISLESSLSAMIQETISQMQESNNRMRFVMAKEAERLGHNSAS
jgi:hypothetical protein